MSSSILLPSSLPSSFSVTRETQRSHHRRMWRAQRVRALRPDASLSVCVRACTPVVPGTVTPATSEHGNTVACGRCTVAAVTIPPARMAFVAPVVSSARVPPEWRVSDDATWQRAASCPAQRAASCPAQRARTAVAGSSSTPSSVPSPSASFRLCARSRRSARDNASNGGDNAGRRARNEHGDGQSRVSRNEHRSRDAPAERSRRQQHASDPTSLNKRDARNARRTSAGGKAAHDDDGTGDDDDDDDDDDDGMITERVDVPLNEFDFLDARGRIDWRKMPAAPSTADSTAAAAAGAFSSVDARNGMLAGAANENSVGDDTGNNGTESYDEHDERDGGGIGALRASLADAERESDHNVGEDADALANVDSDDGAADNPRGESHGAFAVVPSSSPLYLTRSEIIAGGRIMRQSTLDAIGYIDDDVDDDSAPSPPTAMPSSSSASAVHDDDSHDNNRIVSAVFQIRLARSSEYHVRGRVRARVTAPCDRCAHAVRVPIRGAFDVRLTGHAVDDNNVSADDKGDDDTGDCSAERFSRTGPPSTAYAGARDAESEMPANAPASADANADARNDETSRADNDEIFARHASDVEAIEPFHAHIDGVDMTPHVRDAVHLGRPLRVLCADGDECRARVERIGGHVDEDGRVQFHSVEGGGGGTVDTAAAMNELGNGGSSRGDGGDGGDGGHDGKTRDKGWSPGAMDVLQQLKQQLEEQERRAAGSNDNGGGSGGNNDDK